MADRVAVNSELIKRDMQVLETSVDSISAKLVDFRFELMKLAGSWQGDASEAFAETVQKDFEFFAELINELRNYCLCLEDAALDYVGCENEVATQIAMM